MSDIQVRRPTEADHPRLIRLVDEWWGGRPVRRLLPRLWLAHFAGTSWLVEDEDERPIAFLVGFISQDRPVEAVIQMAGTSPNHRRMGLGRGLYERFLSDAAARGVQRVTAVAWPGDPIATAFHRALGFTAETGPGSQNLYGTPAYADYDAEGEDRVVFSRVV